MRTKRKSKPRGKQTCHNHRERPSLAPTRPARETAWSSTEAQRSPWALGAAEWGLRGGGTSPVTTAGQGSHGQERSWAGARLLAEGPGTGGAPAWGARHSPGGRRSPHSAGEVGAAAAHCAWGRSPKRPVPERQGAKPEYNLSLRAQTVHFYSDPWVNKQERSKTTAAPSGSACVRTEPRGLPAPPPRPRPSAARGPCLQPPRSPLTGGVPASLSSLLHSAVCYFKKAKLENKKREKNPQKNPQNNTSCLGEAILSVTLFYFCTFCHLSPLWA